MGSIREMEKVVREGLERACPWQRKTQKEKLSMAICGFLESRTANTMETASMLPLRTRRTDMKYQWLSRLLANHRVVPFDIMKPFGKQMMEELPGKKVEIVIDETRINEKHAAVMISLRWGTRGIPLIWKVKKGTNNIGYEEQKKLLEKVKEIIPKGKKVLLQGDRFYGTMNLIELCAEWSWNYRLRLKKNFLVKENRYKTKLSKKKKEAFLKDVFLGEREVKTSIGIVHEKGHEEPWIIAMNGKPTKEKVMEYKNRWSIEAMFSDYKSRGMGLEDTQLVYSDRIERLILILGLGIYWATKIGKEDAEKKSIAI